MSTSADQGRQPGGQVADQYPGQRLGLPPTGRGSVSSWRRRVFALVVDWFASLLVAALIGRALGLSDAWTDWLPLVAFWLEAAVGTALAGGSFGQLALGLQVRRLDGRRLDLAGALLRSLLVCLVLPAVVYNRDNRGLHDLAVRSVVLNR